MEMTDHTRQSTDIFLHYGADNAQEHGEVKIDATQWHNWAVEWTPKDVTAYVDGKQWWHTDKPRPSRPARCTCASSSTGSRGARRRGPGRRRCRSTGCASTRSTRRRRTSRSCATSSNARSGGDCPSQPRHSAVSILCSVCRSPPPLSHDRLIRTRPPRPVCAGAWSSRWRSAWSSPWPRSRSRPCARRLRSRRGPRDEHAQPRRQQQPGPEQHRDGQPGRALRHRGGRPLRLAAAGPRRVRREHPRSGVEALHGPDHR